MVCGHERTPVYTGILQLAVQLMGRPLHRLGASRAPLPATHLSGHTSPVVEHRPQHLVPRHHVA